ncbi:MAG: hypothetical protein OSW77_10050 [Proteobacteria bacterium]|nr:hypothetical protein [Pseudomonadota bacterium]
MSSGSDSVAVSTSPNSGTARVGGSVPGAARIGAGTSAAAPPASSDPAQSVHPAARQCARRASISAPELASS